MDETHPDAPSENDEDDGDVTRSADWPTWAEPYLEAVRRGNGFVRAADIAGKAPSTVRRLVQRDETFAIARMEALDFALDAIQATLFAAATAGLPVKKTVTKRVEGKVEEVTETESFERYLIAGMFLLKRWRPEFRESYRIEQTGPHGGPVQHEVTLVEEVADAARAELTRLRDAELERLLREEA